MTLTGQSLCAARRLTGRPVDSETIVIEFREYVGQSSQFSIEGSLGASTDSSDAIMMQNQLQKESKWVISSSFLWYVIYRNENALNLVNRYRGYSTVLSDNILLLYARQELEMGSFEGLESLFVRCSVGLVLCTEYLVRYILRYFVQSNH